MDAHISFLAISLRRPGLDGTPHFLGLARRFLIACVRIEIDGDVTCLSRCRIATFALIYLILCLDV